MHSPNLTDDETAPEKLKNPTTPRRASAVKRTPNGTPTRKASAVKACTPTSAPARTKTGSKKVEPTLFSDFLLGRPSSTRVRRRSLDAVKTEMREGMVKKLQSPGGVRDRVRQWQKSNVAAGVADPTAPASEPDETLVHVDESSVDEDDRMRIKMSKTRPARRKSREVQGYANTKGRGSTPRKRVISDDHWMAKKNSLPTMKEAGGAILDDFLKTESGNPLLENKIDDWVRRTENDDKSYDEPRARKPSRHDSLDDSVRSPAKIESRDDGVRASRSREDSVGDGRMKSVRKKRSKVRLEDPKEFRTPRKKSENYMKSVDIEREAADNLNDGNSQIYGEKNLWRTPSLSRRQNLESKTPPESLDEIPFGSSAFSVLDLPVGADAGTMRRPKTQQNPSLSALPKVLRKVYNEGRKIVHDAVDPPRSVSNQPPSIESWLNGTTDPFIDNPTVPEPASEIPESRRQSYMDDDPSERDLIAVDYHDRSCSGKHHARCSYEPDAGIQKLNEERSFGQTTPRNTAPVSDNSPPVSPTGLRRSPATRNNASPVRSTRKVPLKDALIDAFRGESTTFRPRSSSTPFVVASNERDGQNDSHVDFKSSSHSRDVSHALGRNFKLPDTTSSDVPNRQPEKPYPAFGKRQGPTTGGHRLSTIASVETSSTISSASEAASALSQTTITQDMAHTVTTASDLTRYSNKSGLKRRLTKHSDLISMLSLPDSAVMGRSNTIKSARSVRTARCHLDTATTQDLLRELVDDESKYMRELKTLVDGVIPVLLTCVLSKSESAIAAGLCNRDSGKASNVSFTKPIVEMGVALERLKSLHRHMPLEDTNALLSWALSAHKTYQDYLAAWRTGFEDVVVSLAPASRRSSAEERTLRDGMPLNANGDVVNTNGERVDVAFLLKRPLVRVKYLAKLTKGIDKVKPSELSGNVMSLYQQLESKCRRRAKEEAARRVDQSANDTDPTRARDPRTLASVDGVKIDRTRQVCAKDFFTLDITHSSGQRIECAVELLLRDKPSDAAGLGDVLICKIDGINRCLLFPPISKELISARIGDEMGQVVVMIRGFQEGKEWREILMLQTDDNETATEWVEMLGLVPIPPPIVPITLDGDLPPVLSVSHVQRTTLDMSNAHADDVDVPIGERRPTEAEDTPMQTIQGKTAASGRSQAASTVSQSKKSFSSETHVPGFNDAMIKAENLSGMKRTGATRYHSSGDKSQITDDRRHADRKTTTKPSDDSMKGQSNNVEGSGGGTITLPILAKVKQSRPSAQSFSTPLKEDMRPEAETMKNRQPVTPKSHSKSVRHDGAPPPPAHKTLTPSTSKKAPALETPTPKAKNRRSSSPLKHEYQPSDASGTSSCSDDSDSQDDGTSDSSDDEELEAADLPGALPDVSIYGKRVSPSGSLYSFPNSTLAPSNSASQAPYRGVPLQANVTNSKKISAMISSWSNKKGRWEDLYPEPCSIVISPGLIEAFEMSASHSSPTRADPNLESSGASDLDPADDAADAGADRPLVALELTPLVSLRQSTALDIEIQSPPTARSRLKCSGTVRYRALTVLACRELYQAIHRARLDNPIYKKLEQERMFNSYGGKSYEAAVRSSRRRSWFGRKKSYRASARAPSATTSDQSGNSHSSLAVSALKRMSGGSVFNIAKSSVDTAQGQAGKVSAPTSSYTSSSESATSGVTPPRTPTSPSLAGTATSNVVNLGSENLKIRLYILETSTKWNDLGAARLTVSQPPPGMRQASALYHGIEKRIVVTRKLADSGISKGQADNQVLLDVVLGSGCFSKVGRTGVAVNVWEDITGPNGEVGMVGAVGGLSGRTRKWMFHVDVLLMPTGSLV